MRLRDAFIDNFIDTSYCVGYRWNHKQLWEEEKSEFSLLKQSLRYWYADPIPCEVEGNIYVFMEQYDRLKKKGYIAVSRVEQGRLRRPNTIIKAESHLSFPTVIPYKGEYYLIPEAAQTGNIEIYKMEDTIEQWEHYYSIRVNERIVDISYVLEGDRLLLLGGVEEENPLYSRRVIFQINHLNDPNNITCEQGYRDAASSLQLRNGGNIWKENNQRFIATQESTETDYGMYILLQEIGEISLHSIRMDCKGKKTSINIEIPQLNKLLYRKIGTHTYGRCGKLEVVDLSLTKISLLPFLRKCRLIQ